VRLAASNQGDDYLDGEAGDDHLTGQGGNDTLFGKLDNLLESSDDVSRLAGECHQNDFCNDADCDCVERPVDAIQWIVLTGAASNEEVFLCAA
jgi:Ca2+-binding RTX toxin-like protein